MVDISYQASVQPESLPGRAIPRLPESVPEAAFGGEIGRSLENVGSTIQQHVDVVMKQAQQAQLTDAHNQMQALSLDLTHNPQTGAFTKQGKDAFGLTQQYLPQFDEASQKIIAGIPDPQARLAAGRAAAQLRDHLTEQLDTHELEQHRQFGINTAKASVSLAQQTAAANYNHPDIVATNLDHVDASLESLGQQQGWSSETLEEAKHEAHVQFHQGVLTNMLADNKVDMAKAYLGEVRGELKPEEVKLATRAIEAGQVKATADSIMGAYSTDTLKGAQAITDLNKSGLTQEQQFSVIQEVERQRGELAMQRRQDRGISQQLTGLQDSIAKGTPSPGALGQVDALWRKGALSDDQRQALRNRIEGIQTDANNDQERMNWITDHYHNSVPIDPKSADNQKLVGQMFTQMTKGISPNSPEYGNYAADVARRIGVIPEPAVSWARANLVGGDPKSAAQAADLVSRVVDASPRDVDFAIDRETRAIAQSISSAVKAGTSPEAAVEIARKNAELGASESKELDEKWKKVQTGQASDLVSRLGKDDRFKSGFMSSVPTVPAAMQSEYDTLTQEYFKYTGGDIQQARTLAVSDLNHVWGVSQVNGKRELMPYAPESMYPGLTPEVIRSDIKTAVPEQNADKVRLTLDPQRTARTQGAEWNLAAPTDNGLIELLRDDRGNPLVYRLPITKEDYAAAREPQVQAALEKARAMQEARKESLELREEADRQFGQQVSHQMRDR